MEENNSYQMLNAMMEKVLDIDKDVDEILEKGKENMSDSALPFMMGANMNRGVDAATMAYNNPWMYLIMLAMFGGGGFGWGGWGNRGGAQSGIDTNMLLNAIQAGSATSQRDADRMAQAFGVTSAELNSGLQAVNSSIQQVAGAMGMNTQMVINAVQNGNAGVMQQLQNCCCENRLAICQQTNTLQQGQYQLGVTIERQGEMTRTQQLMLAKDAEIRALQNEVGILRDAAQTATLQGNIAAGDAAIMNKLAEIQTSLQNQITAQGYAISSLSKSSTGS